MATALQSQPSPTRGAGGWRTTPEPGRAAEAADPSWQVLDALPTGVVVLDRAGRVARANPAAAGLLGEPLVGSPWREVIARAFAPRLDDGHEVSLRDGRRVSIATRALEAGPGQLVAITDLTRTRDFQGRLSRQQRLEALGEMLASVAHQIRTPLATALLYASHLGAGELDPAARERFTERLLASLRGLERLIRDMLLFVRSGSYRLQPLPASELARGLRSVLEAPLVRAGARLTCRCETGSVAGHQEALLAALQNLALNALEAGALELQFTALARDGGVELAIADDGPGIPESIRERVFDPFFTTRAAGTGLGLAVVQAVAKAHGGAVRCTARAAGGCRMGLWLPAAGPAEEAA